MIVRPPCSPSDRSQPNPCAQAHYDRVVHGNHSFTGEWLGWKQRGRWLVSPNGDRISPERMKGILWRLQAEERRDSAKARNAQRRKAVSQEMVKVVVVNLADWHAQRFGSRAG